MLLVVLKPSKRAERYLKNDNIDIIRLETVINYIARYVDTRKKIEIIHIPFDIDCRKEDSEYFFSSKDIVIAGIYKNSKTTSTRSKRLKYLIECLVHEFRHCLQEIIFKKSQKDIDYISSDGDEYKNNILEKDARWFEEKYSKKAYELYRFLKKCKVRNVEFFHE